MTRSMTTRSTNPKIMDDNIKILDDALGGITAEDVPYDNTDSGLTATNIQSAIDELAGDYIEIIPDGVKDYATLLNELANLMDFTKVNMNSKYALYDGERYYIFNVIFIKSSDRNAIFSKVNLGSSGSDHVMITEMIRIAYNNSMNETLSGSTYTNGSSSVFPNTYKLIVKY